MRSTNLVGDHRCAWPGVKEDLEHVGRDARVAAHVVQRRASALVHSFVQASVHPSIACHSHTVQSSSALCQSLVDQSLSHSRSQSVMRLTVRVCVWACACLLRMRRERTVERRVYLVELPRQVARALEEEPETLGRDRAAHAEVVQRRAAVLRATHARQCSRSSEQLTQASTRAITHNRVVCDTNTAATARTTSCGNASSASHVSSSVRRCAGAMASFIQSRWSGVAPN